VYYSVVCESSIKLVPVLEVLGLGRWEWIEMMDGFRLVQGSMFAEREV
jgi:protein involved in temperature-dependent protein secretion